MATVPFSNLTGSTLREAARKSIQEAREAKIDEKREVVKNTFLGRSVRSLRTGATGRVVQELNYGFHLRIRWDGKRGQGSVTREKIDDLHIIPEMTEDKAKELAESYRLIAQLEAEKGESGSSI